MASSRSWTFDDDDRPSGSVRPLSQADLQAILAQLADDPDGLLAGTGADRPVVAVRVQATAGGLLPVAVLTVLSLALALATEEPQAAEGVAVQPDRRPQVGEGVGVVGQGLLGELDLGEADHRMRPLAVWPGRARRPGRRTRACVVLASPGGVLDPADMGQGVDGLMQHGLQGSGRSLRPGTRRRRTARAADRPRAARGPCSVGWPSTQWSAPKWPHLASMCKALEESPVPVTTTTSGSSGVRWRMSVQVCSRAAMRPEQVVSTAVTEPL
jgi:hypothetical protein